MECEPKNLFTFEDPPVVTEPADVFSAITPSSYSFNTSDGYVEFPVNVKENKFLSVEFKTLNIKKVKIEVFDKEGVVLKSFEKPIGEENVCY